ncbi:hypothetical protein TMatcc_007579 [Talaromyces marneffei ATCC 18224]
METFQPISSTLPVRYQPACPLRSWSLPMPDIFIMSILLRYPCRILGYYRTPKMSRYSRCRSPNGFSVQQPPFP